MTIAVIGADAESVHAIRQARKQGIKVIAVDQDSHAPGLKEADVQLNIPISDEERVIDALKEENIDLVLTAPIGRHLATVGAVNDALNLPGIGRDSAVLCSDKYAFHNRLRNVKLRIGHCYLVNERHPFDPSKMTYPAVFKPRFGSHGRSVHYIENDAQLLKLEQDIWGDGRDADESVEESGSGNDAIAFAQKIKRTMEAQYRKASTENAPEDDYILEEAFQGVEYTVDGVVEGCNFEMVLLRRKLIADSPSRQAIGYLAVMQDEEHRLVGIVNEYMSRLCEVMNLKDCVLHADVMVMGRKINAIEVSASPAGNHIYDEFLPMSTGVDICSQYLAYMIGEVHNFSPLNSRRTMIHFFEMQNCFVHGIPSVESLKEKLPEKIKLRKWECNMKLLDYMGIITDEKSLRDRGYYILEGPSEKALLESADIIMRAFELK